MPLRAPIAILCALALTACASAGGGDAETPAAAVTGAPEETTVEIGGRLSAEEFVEACRAPGTTRYAEVCRGYVKGKLGGRAYTRQQLEANPEVEAEGCYDPIPLEEAMAAVKADIGSHPPAPDQDALIYLDEVFARHFPCTG